MTEEDWTQLTAILRNIGLVIVRVDKNTGDIHLRVPPLKTQ